MNSDKQLNYVNNLQNRDQNLYYVDDASELNSIDLKENDKIYAINDNKLFQMEIVDQEEELSGDIVSFKGRNNTKIKSLAVNIEPQQDLHGYDYPWPAGGGKNKLQVTATTQTINGVTFTVNSDGTINVSGTATASTTFTTHGYQLLSDYGIESGIAYMLSGTPTGLNRNAYIMLSVYGSGSEWRDTTGNGASFTPSDVTKQYRVLIIVSNGTTINAVFKPMICLASASNPTTFAPYSNICPISGWTGLTGFDDPVYGGTIKRNQVFPLLNASYTETNFTITSARDGAFVVTATATASSSTAGNVTGVGAGVFTAGHIYAFLGTKYGIQCDLKGYSLYSDAVFRCGKPSYNNVTFVFTNLPAGTYKVYPMLFDLTEMFGATKAEEILAMGSSAGAAFVKALFPKDYYAFDTSYEETCVSAVNGDPYREFTADWSEVAGTVYGGTLDLVSGKLTVDRAMVDLGTLNWSYMESPAPVTGEFHLFRSPITPTPKERFDGIVSSYNYVGPYSYMINDKTAGYIYNTNIAIHDDSYTDVATFKTAMNGVQLLYELATPITYQLTPQEVDTLYGTNNIQVDTGSINIKITEKGITAFELEPHI